VSAPSDAQELPVVVWFHGGGLSEGSKHFSPLLKNENIVLVGAGYRLTPKAKFPDFLEDTAAAVAWTFANIDRYGGDAKKIVVGGHSAGAYLSAMVGLDPRWLKPHQLEPSRIAGLILISGQMTTHFNVRKILNYSQPEHLPIIDENAPLHYLSKNAPPILLILGDRKIEWPARVEENEWMYATLRAMKHPHVEFHENIGFDHGGVGNAPAAAQQMKAFLNKIKNVR
jgi:acetyl esterase/lipase